MLKHRSGAETETLSCHWNLSTFKEFQASSSTKSDIKKKKKALENWPKQIFVSYLSRESVKLFNTHFTNMKHTPNSSANADNFTFPLRTDATSHYRKPPNCNSYQSGQDFCISSMWKMVKTHNHDVFNAPPGQHSLYCFASYSSPQLWGSP